MLSSFHCFVLNFWSSSSTVNSLGLILELISEVASNFVSTEKPKRSCDKKQKSLKMVEEKKVKVVDLGLLEQDDEFEEFPAEGSFYHLKRHLTVLKL